MLKLSQSKINALTAEKFAEYKAYLLAQGVPQFEIDMLSQRVKPSEGEASDKPNATLSKLIGAGLTKTKIREQLAKYKARFVVCDESGKEVLSVDCPVKDSSSSGNIMLGANGPITLPGYGGTMQGSFSLTANKSAGLPE